MATYYKVSLVLDFSTSQLIILPPSQLALRPFLSSATFRSTYEVGFQVRKGGGSEGQKAVGFYMILPDTFDHSDLTILTSFA